MKDWLVLVCIVILGVLAFREHERWVSHRVTSTAIPSEAVLPAPKGEPVPFHPPEVAQPAPPSPDNTELAKLVAQSQQVALARYPALGTVNSEISIRYGFRCKRLVDEHSPRLQDPTWPLQLADECAQAAGIRPVTVRAASPSTGTVPPGGPSTQSPPLASSMPATSQPLNLPPANGGASPMPLAGGSAFTSALKSSGPLPFVTLEAVNQKSANNYVYNSGYDYGWYDLSFRQSVGISMNVRNMSRDPVAVNLRWIFFARQTHNNERFVFGASSKDFHLAPGQNATATADSPMLQRREVNDAWLGQRYLSGSKYEGWLVQLMESGSNRIIKQTGSNGYLEDLAKRTDFTTLLDDYRVKLHSGAGETSDRR